MQMVLSGERPKGVGTHTSYRATGASGLCGGRAGQAPVDHVLRRGSDSNAAPLRHLGLNFVAPRSLSDLGATRYNTLPGRWSVRAGWAQRRDSVTSDLSAAFLGDSLALDGAAASGYWLPARAGPRNARQIDHTEHFESSICAVLQCVSGINVAVDQCDVGPAQVVARSLVSSVTSAFSSVV